MTQAERIFAANFPDAYRAALVRFPEPSPEVESPRGKLKPSPFENGPTLAQPGVPITPDVERLRRETRIARQLAHLCLTCGAPAKFYPKRHFNQWGKLCSYHAEVEASYVRAKRKQSPVCKKQLAG